jgi:hypothetical protein
MTNEPVTFAELMLDATFVQIVRAHSSARPTRENPAWMNTHHDLAYVIDLIERFAEREKGK